MAKRIKFTATFANGVTAERTSDRKEYTHAWQIAVSRGPIPAAWSPERQANCLHEGSIRVDTGFATTRELAERAAQSAFGSLSPKRGKYLRQTGEGTPRTYTLVSSEVVAVEREG